MVIVGISYTKSNKGNYNRFESVCPRVPTPTVPKGFGNHKKSNKKIVKEDPKEEEFEE